MSEVNNAASAPLLGAVRECELVRMKNMERAEARSDPERVAVCVFSPPFLCASSSAGTHGVSLNHAEAVVLKDTAAQEGAVVSVHMKGTTRYMFYAGPREKQQMEAWMGDQSWYRFAAGDSWAYTRVEVVGINIPSNPLDALIFTTENGSEIKIQ